MEEIKIRVLGGTFSGLEGVLLERGESGCKVRLDLFGRDVETDLTPDQFEPIGNRDYSSLYLDEIRDDQKRTLEDELAQWWLGRKDTQGLVEQREDYRAFKDTAERQMHERLECLCAQFGAQAGEYVSDPDRLKAWFKETSRQWLPHRHRLREITPSLDWDTVFRRRRNAWRAWWAANLPARDEAEGARPAIRKSLKEAGAGDYEALLQAEADLVDTWGAVAIEEMLRRRYGGSERALPDIDVTPLSEVPEACYWSGLGAEPVDKAILKIFDPIREHAPVFVDTLAARARALFGLRYKGRWHLLYLMDAGEGISLLGGLLPAVDPRLSDELLDLDWSLPASLAKFYQCHNGFGALMIGTGSDDLLDHAQAIPRAENLEALGKIMNPIANTQNFVPEGYRFDDLLGFFEDGGGNGHYFHRAHPDEPDPITVFWDHETRAIGGGETFWAFLDDESTLSWIS